MRAPLPAFVPSHQSLVASDAAGAAAWAASRLNLTRVDAHTGAGESHAYAGGVCAEIEWLEVSRGGWELHFIEQFVKREGALKVKAFEDYLARLRGRSLGTFDAYMNFRAAFSVPSLAPFVAALDALGEPFLLRHNGARMLVQAPNGAIFELFVDDAAAADDGETAARRGQAGGEARAGDGAPPLRHVRGGAGAASAKRSGARRHDRFDASAAEAAIAAAEHE